MTKYQEYAKKPRAFLALTGYTREEFDALLPHFEQQFYAQMQTQRLDGQPRGNRPYCDYRNSPLPTSADKLCFILHYLKTNSLQTTQGALFSMSQSYANLWIHCLHPILNRTLAALAELPARHMTALTFAADEPYLYFHDGTERAIPRPRDPTQERQYYSGKKKQHNLKNNVLIDMQCRLRFLSETVEGKKHDKKLADETAYVLPAASKLSQDTGFQGFTVPEVTILQPIKKPRGAALTAWQKSINQWHASWRVRVEHAIGGVKRYRIVKDKIRNWKADFRDLVLETCCGLHNFRLHFRPWTYPPLQLHLGVTF